MNFNTGFYEKGSLIKCRFKIIRNYVIHGTFATDFITFLSIFFMPRKFALIYLYKIVKIQDLITNLEKFLFIGDILFNAISLLKLFLNVIYVSHLFACLWYYIAVTAPTESTTWLKQYSLEDSAWSEKYLYSYYFVTVTINTSKSKFSYFLYSWIWGYFTLKHLRAYLCHFLYIDWMHYVWLYLWIALACFWKNLIAKLNHFVRKVYPLNLINFISKYVSMDICKNPIETLNFVCEF